MDHLDHHNTVISNLASGNLKMLDIILFINVLGYNAFLKIIKIERFFGRKNDLKDIIDLHGNLLPFKDIWKNNLLKLSMMNTRVLFTFYQIHGNVS